MRRLALAGAGAALLAAAGLQVVAPMRVTSDSMLPTLRPGERLWVNRLAYRGRDPVRGEVVVVRLAPPGRSPRRFVKRVIGLPGERIDVVDELVFVDGEPLSRRHTGVFTDAEQRVFDVYEVDVPGRPFRVLDDPQHHAAGGRYDVPPGHYFVLGDHRDHSEDSRRFGPIAREALVGRVLGGRL